MATPYGFRVLGAASEPRRLVDHATAFAAYASCDPRAELAREAYLSAFTFAEDFRQWMSTHDSPKGYSGPCGAAWLWIDIDRESIEQATHDARRLAVACCDRWRLGEGDPLFFFSGRKGYHLGLPLGRCGSPLPSPSFHLIARALAVQLGEAAAVAIDQGVYDKQRLLRSPNSRHPRTGLFKVWLSLDELMHLRPQAILRIAESTREFEIPAQPHPDPRAIADWNESTESLVSKARELAERRQNVTRDSSRLNWGTLEFIRQGADIGDRHRLLFSSAANLGELGCSAELAIALLFESARDSGLSPFDINRTIRCGVEAASKGI